MLLDIGGIKCDDEEVENKFATLWLLISSGNEITIEKYIEIVRQMVMLMKYCSEGGSEIHDVELTLSDLYKLMENPLFQYQKFDLEGIAIYLDECAKINGKMFCSSITESKLLARGIDPDKGTITTVKVMPKGTDLQGLISSSP